MQLRLAGGVCSRATVLVEADEGGYEVAVPGSGDLLVSAEAIAPLLDFERDAAADCSPAEARNRGNTLFGLGDFASAFELYRRGFEGLTRGAFSALSVGAAVVIDRPEDPFTFRSGIVCDVSHSSCSVLLDGSDEETRADLNRLLCIGRDGSDERELVRALSMNLGRCSLKLSRKAWAVRWFSAALAVVQAGEADYPDKSKHLADALSGRVASYLALGKLRRARSDIAALLAVDAARGARLQRQWEEQKRTRAGQDRRLAREVARWVETAVASSERLGGSRGSALALADASLSSEHSEGEADGQDEEKTTGCSMA